jgi:DNA transformation protein
VGRIAKTTPTVKSSKARRPLRSLRVSNSFRDFVLDQLADLPDLRAKAMFGGVGLYSGEHFFGILAGDELYLKTDESTRGAFATAGGQPFTPYPDRGTTMSYYSVPVSILESAPEVVRWARRAVAVARAGRPSAGRKRRAVAKRRSP